MCLLRILVALSAVAMASAIQQCNCDRLRQCMQDSGNAMESCAKSPRCANILGGNQAAVRQCIDQKTQQMRTGMQCMASGMGNMGCSNDPNPRDIQSFFKMPGGDDHEAMMGQIPGVVGQFMQCVMNCAKSGGARRVKRSPQCLKKLGCTLDFRSMDFGQMMQTKKRCMGDDMEGKMQQHCQCLVNAGVNVDCQQLAQFAQQKMGGMQRRLSNLRGNNGRGIRFGSGNANGGSNQGRRFGGFNRNNNRGVRFGNQ